MNSRAHVVIAISRQMGSGGSYIGYLLAKELEFRYIDREILREAAKSLGTDVGFLEKYDERSSGIIANILRCFSFGNPETGGVPPVHPPIYDKDLFTLECTIMNRFADRHDAVIVGRGGFHALRDRSNVFKVFIHAPEGFRIERMMQVRNISKRQARAMIEDSDRRRTRFIRDMAGVEWTDARNYHLCIDSNIMDFDIASDLIIDIVRKKFIRN